jgi:hypothetical protein
MPYASTTSLVLVRREGVSCELPHVLLLDVLLPRSTSHVRASSLVETL